MLNSDRYRDIIITPLFFDIIENYMTKSMRIILKFYDGGPMGPFRKESYDKS